jgi:hypothetical protein
MGTSVIKAIVDISTDKATKALKDLKKDLAAADGNFGKIKVAGSAAFTQLTQHATSFALTAGAALIGFGVKAASAFTGLALEAGKFADATGLATEDASRWIEVAGDVGIGADQIQGAILKMNKAIGAGALKEFEGDIVRAKDGTVEASATFENLITKIGAIKDPTDRAAAAQKAFGKGFASVAELMEMDATELRAALEGVSDAKIIDEGELERARVMRDRIDQLKDKFEDFQLEVGEKVVPVLVALADQAIVVADAVGTVSSVIDASIDIVERAVGVNEDEKRSVDEVYAAQLKANEGRRATTEEISRSTDATRASAEGLEAFGGFVGLVADAQTQLQETIAEANDAMLEQAAILQEQIDAQRAAADAGFALRDAQADLAEKVGGANDAMKEADGDLYKVRAVLDDVAESAGAVADNTVRVWEEQSKANGTTLTAVQKQDLWNDSMLANAATLEGPMRDAVLDYVGQVNGIPPEKVSEIKALIEEGKIDEANAMLDEASRTRDAAIEAQALTDQAEQDLEYLARDRNARINAQVRARGGIGLPEEGEGDASNRASGGPVVGGNLYEVGEGGKPELLDAGGRTYLIPGNQGGMVRPAVNGGGAGGRSSGGTTSNTYSITVNVAPGGDPASTGRALVEAIQDYERVNSSRWRAS